MFIHVYTCTFINVYDYDVYKVYITSFILVIYIHVHIYIYVRIYIYIIAYIVKSCGDLDMFSGNMGPTTWR
jgi:hypothetical protein